MSIATGHHVMQRPQPTHPDDPNWSCHVPSLWVIHCRYRERPEGRTAPPWMCEWSTEKHESHSRQRSACAPSRSVTSSTDEQKRIFLPKLMTGESYADYARAQFAREQKMLAEIGFKPE